MQVKDLLLESNLSSLLSAIFVSDISCDGNILVFPGKATFTSSDYIELSSHAQTDTYSNAKSIFEYLSSCLSASLDNEISGKNSMSIGKGFALGEYSIACGGIERGPGQYPDRPFAIGDSSIALGNLAKATKLGAVSLGSSVASGQYSTAMAAGLASGYCSLAACFGIASADQSIALGNKAQTYKNANCIAIGNNVSSCGLASFAEGQTTYSSGRSSHAEGNSTSAIGDYSHAEGRLSKAFDSFTHAEGYSTSALSSCAHAEGYGTAASVYSHSEGRNTSALGYYCHAEGNHNIIYPEASCSHVEGESNLLYGNYLHIAGQQNIAYGNNNTVIAGKNNNISGSSNCIGGMYNYADGSGSFIYGYQISNFGEYSVAFGRTIEIPSQTSRAFVFNGTSTKCTSNGNGTFNLMLPNGISGMYINNKSLADYISAGGYSPPLAGKTYSMSRTYLSTLLFDVAQALGAQIVD